VVIFFMVSPVSAGPRRRGGERWFIDCAGEPIGVAPYRASGTPRLSWPG